MISRFMHMMMYVFFLDCFLIRVWGEVMLGRRPVLFHEKKKKRVVPEREVTENEQKEGQKNNVVSQKKNNVVACRQSRPMVKASIVARLNRQ